MRRAARSAPPLACALLTAALTLLQPAAAQVDQQTRELAHDILNELMETLSGGSQGSHPIAEGHADMSLGQQAGAGGTIN